MSDPKSQSKNNRKKQPSKPESPFIYKTSKATARRILKVLVRSIAKDIESQKKLVNGAIKFLRDEGTLLDNIQSNPDNVTGDKTTKLALRFLKWVASRADGKHTKWAKELLCDIRKALGSEITKHATGFRYDFYPIGLKADTGEVTVGYRRTPIFSEMSTLPILNPESPKNQTNSPLILFWKERAKELKSEFKIEETLRTLDKIEAELKKYSKEKIPPLIARDYLSFKKEVIAHAQTAIKELREEMGKEDLLNLVKKYQKKIESVKDKTKKWEENRVAIDELFLKLFKKPLPVYIEGLLRNPRCSSNLIALAFVSHKYGVRYESLRSLYHSEDYVRLRDFLSLK